MKCSSKLEFQNSIFMIARFGKPKIIDPTHSKSQNIQWKFAALLVITLISQNSTSTPSCPFPYLLLLSESIYFFKKGSKKYRFVLNRCCKVIQHTLIFYPFLCSRYDNDFHITKSYYIPLYKANFANDEKTISVKLFNVSFNGVLIIT